MSDTTKVLLCWHWDPFETAPGGIARFIEDFIEYAPADFDFWLPALTRQALVPYEPVRHVIRGRPCTVIPVAHRHAVARVPQRLRYAFAIRRLTRRQPLDGFVVHYHGIEPWLGLEDKKKNAHVLLLHKNPSYRWNFRSESKWRFLPPALYYRIEKTMLNCTDGVFFVNRQCFDEYRQRYAGLSERMTLIATGVDPKSFFPPSTDRELNEARARVVDSLGLPSRSRMVLYFGRFDEIKDPVLLIEAWRDVHSSHPDTHLLLVGSGKLEATMHRRIAELELGASVKVIEPQQRTTIRELLWTSAVSVLPSRSEGMSMALNESLASGCPAIGFDVGDIRRVVQAGRSGEIVLEHEAKHLADAISKVLDNSDRYTAGNCVNSVAAFNPERVLAPLYAATQRYGQRLTRKAAS